MKNNKTESSIDRWLGAAYELLIEGGVDAVKIMTLAKRTGLTRTGFYWHFEDLNALLDALIQRWQAKNTDSLTARAGAPADTITEAMFNVFDCWHIPDLFDARLDLAVRNWSRLDPKVRDFVADADNRRIHALQKMFERFGYDKADANVRSLTVIYTQIGYISMDLQDSVDMRLTRVSHYVKVFTGKVPTENQLRAFLSRIQKR